MGVRVVVLALHVAFRAVSQRAQIETTAWALPTSASLAIQPSMGRTLRYRVLNILSQRSSHRREVWVALGRHVCYVDLSRAGFWQGSREEERSSMGWRTAITLPSDFTTSSQEV